MSPTPSPVKRRIGTVRWSNEEWLQAAVAALPAVLAGTEPGLALFEGQRLVLPKTRWHKRNILHACCKRPASVAQVSMEKARDMSAEDRTRVYAASPVQKKRIEAGERDAPPPPAPGTMVEKTHRGAWNTKEWAIISRRVEHLKTIRPKWAVSRLVLEAQLLDLPPERRRARSGVYTGVTNGTLARGLENGRTHLWLLHDTLDPNRTEWAPPPPPAPAAAQPAQEARQEAQEAPIAPAPMAAQPAPLLAASIAFGEAMVQQLDVVLRAQREQILADLMPRVNAMGAEIAAMIEHGLRSTVQQIVAHELGGAELPPPPPPGKIKVDVFAFPARINATEIRAALNGNAEVRFLNPHDTQKYIPPEGAHIIFTTDNIPKSARYSIEAAGIKPMTVANSPPKVIEAIRGLVGPTAH